jgi:hypothetical protein
MVMPTLLKGAFRLVPKVVRERMMAAAIRAPTKTYSIAVTPPSFRKKVFTKNISALVFDA